jgi:hypothetical protein
MGSMVSIHVGSHHRFTEKTYIAYIKVIHYYTPVYLLVRWRARGDMASVRDRGGARARVWPEHPRIWSEGGEWAVATTPLQHPRVWSESGGVVVAKTPSRLEREQRRRRGENTLTFGARAVGGRWQQHPHVWSEGGGVVLARIPSRLLLLLPSLSVEHLSRVPGALHACTCVTVREGAACAV